MVNFTPSSNRETLEKIWSKECLLTTSGRGQSKFKTVLRQFLQWLTMNDRLRVWTDNPDATIPLWNAHDPVTGNSITGLSESEMRRWLEQRIHGLDA
ncbi:MAG: hypothetical protein HC835_18955 [Oscillatoriales cyanobacterium RM2_1_1]|nr:hypothetical protein [Oscillatoriales cyanobacterium SM2_3_0]NJO47512.1 hypothetical protein [Oscillatoriales cyanobacterium RM2_1_1]